MYDESIDVTNAEEVRSPTPESVDSNYGKKKVTSLLREESVALAGQRAVKGYSGASTSRPMSGIARLDRNAEPSRSTRDLAYDVSDNSDDDNDDDDDDDDDDDVQAALLEGTYDPRAYEHLAVSPDMKDIFQYITCYTPQNVELEYKLRPFIPDFIPAVGDIDAFIKVTRPDGVNDGVGLNVLDEPCANQSEPAVLCLQLRASTKQSSAKPVVVKKVESAEKNPKAVDKWIRDINELHKSKPAPTVQYSRPMPDIDTLMQEWPSQFEEKLNQIGLPTGDLDCDLPTFVDIICSLFDIPRYESRIESLHVLFTLYSAIKNSQFRKPEDT